MSQEVTGHEQTRALMKGRHEDEEDEVEDVWEWME